MTTGELDLEVEPLEPSELGNTEYWEEFYNKELENLHTEADDEGTDWFSDARASDRMIKYLKTELGIPHDASFLDLGTGNGTLIFKLFEEGFDGIHVGVDYSEASIKLVKEKSEEIRAQKESEHDLSFWQYDILRGEHKNWMPDGGFDVVLDKGTFDAISLSSETDQTTGKRVFHNYAAKVIPLIKKGGRLLITSCNWTESELKGWFEAESRPGSLKYQGRISYPTFQFGGATGQSVCSLCFLRES